MLNRTGVTRRRDLRRRFQKREEGRKRRLASRGQGKVLRLVQEWARGRKGKCSPFEVDSSATIASFRKVDSCEKRSTFLSFRYFGVRVISLPSCPILVNCGERLRSIFLRNLLIQSRKRIFLLFLSTFTI